MMPDNQHRSIKVSPQVAFLLVSLSLGQLGDGLNIFQGIYLVGRGWNEGSVGLALSLMGLTALIIQPWAGDWVDKTTVDRRILLAGSCLMTALSASSILLVHKGNTDHMLIFSTKILEGAMSSFLGPCLAALTLACFGPNDFDAVMASNILWGHVGSVAAAVLAGIVSYILYPDVEYCFLVIGASALIACFFLQYLPQGDPLMGRGFATKESPSMKIEVEQDTGGTYGFIKPIESDETTLDLDLVLAEADSMNVLLPKNNKEDESPTAASYWEIFTDTKSVILCLTGFFFQ